MYHIDILDQDQLTDFFMSDPQLCLLGLSDVMLCQLYEAKKHPVIENSHFYGIFENNELIGVLRYEVFTKVMAMIHFYLHTNLHHTHKIREITPILMDYMKTRTQFKKLIAPIPVACPHAINAAIGMGFKKEGHFTNAMIWRDKVVDLTWYARNLEEL